MKKLVYALAALSMVALMGLTSCKKEEPATLDIINVQWGCNTHGTTFHIIDLSTKNQVTFAESTDGSTFTKTGTYTVTSIVYSDDAKTVGTITYDNSGVKTIAFKNLSDMLCDFESQQPDAESGQFDTYYPTKYSLQ